MAQQLDVHLRDMTCVVNDKEVMGLNLSQIEWDAQGFSLLQMNQKYKIWKPRDKIYPFLALKTYLCPPLVSLPNVF